MKYFTIRELCKSDTAKRLGIDNTPDAAAKDSLTKLVDNVLDPLRDAWGRAIVVNSGFRCQRLNDVLGGARDSQHKTGEAVDIEDYTKNRERNRMLFELIQNLRLPFDQLINEYDYDWIHVSFGPRNRRQVLKAVKENGKTKYIKL